MSAQPKTNGAAPALDISSKEKKGLTFANQDSLPKLPIPELEKTYIVLLFILRLFVWHRANQSTLSTENFASGFGSF